MIVSSPAEIEIMAYNFGIVLGAASFGDEVSDERFNTVAKRVKTLLGEAAESRSNAELAYARFSAAVVAGRKAAEVGAIKEQAAKSALRQIEDDLTDAHF